MTIKHDEQGFVSGTPVDLGAATKLWTDIHNDVRSIRQAIVRASSPSVSTPANRSAASARSVATPRLRDDRGRYASATAVSSTNGQQTAGSTDSLKRAAIDRLISVKAKTATPGRNSKGQFQSSGDGAGKGGDARANGSGNPPKEPNDSAVKGLLGRLSRAALSSGSGLEEADPTVKAFNEVAQPMARGYELLTGGSEDKKQTGFLRRIFSTLNVFRKEETALEKANAKTLKDIEGKPEGGAEGGGSFIGKVLSQLVSQIPLLGAALAGLKSFLPSLKGAGGGLLDGAKSLGAGALGGAKALGKGALKKIPILGTLLGGVLAWNEANAADSDASLSDDERRGKKAGAWGGAAGGAIGAAIGTVLLPGIGTVVGGMLGDWLGGKFGEMIGGKWEEMTAGISSAWDGAVKKFDSFVDSAKAGWDTVAGLFKSAYEGLKNLPVIGDAIKKVGELATAAKDKVVEVATAATEKTIEVATAAKDKVVEAGGAAVDGAKKSVDYVANNTLVGRGAVAAYQGAKDFGSKLLNRAFSTGAEYTAGNIGGLDEAHTRGLVASTAMTESYGGKLGEVNKQGYMGRYQAGASWLADAGLMRGGSSSVQEAMKRDGFKNEWKWSESGGMSKFLNDPANWKEGMSKEKYLASAETQDAAFKANSDQAYAALLKSGTITGSDSQERIAGLLKARHLAGLGGAKAVASGGNGAVDANGTSARKYYEDVASDRHGLTAAYASTALPPTTTSVSALTVPSAPSMPAVADSPPVIDPIASAGSKTATVSVTTPDVGQDLRDRRIAHVATGALSG